MTDPAPKSDRSSLPSQNLVIDIVWIATNPRGALPGHHWQGTIFNSGEIEYQRRYYKKHLAMEDALAWLKQRTEVEQEIAAMKKALT